MKKEKTLLSKQWYADPNFRWVISVHVGVRMCLWELEYLYFFVAFKLLTFPMERCDAEAFWHFLDHSTIWLEAHHSLRFLMGMWNRVVAVYVQLSEARKIQRAERLKFSSQTIPSHIFVILEKSWTCLCHGILHSFQDGHCGNMLVKLVIVELGV